MSEIPRCFHVLLIGIDAYSSRPLKGCVNDIDAIEDLLLGSPGIAVPADRFKVTRLAAPHPGADTVSRFSDKTLPPTRANILDAFGELAGDTVTAEDRVLVYYSGHGGQRQTRDMTWHESIIPLDEPPITDVELNAWLHAIAKPDGDAWVDLTVVLDCCHSSGATRQLVADLGGDDRVAQRSMPPSSEPIPDPDLSAVPRSGFATESRDPRSPLRPIDPPYVVMAACQSDEVAGEKLLNGERILDGIRQGNLTRALVGRLQDQDAEARASVRWADMWPGLLVEMHRIGAAAPSTPVQNPWLTGRSERRVFGGPWERRDPGFAVTAGTGADRFMIHGGRLMGLTEDAELGVYGADQPTLFAPANSAEDQADQIGRLRVLEAGLADCTAAPAEGQAPFDLPEGARARLLSSGRPERLRVRLEPFDAATAAELEESGVLRVEEDPEPDAEVTVIGDAGQGWEIRNAVEPRVAGVAPGRVDVLRAGLESYARFNQALRLAQTLRSPTEAERLSFRLLHVVGTGPFTDEDLDRFPSAPLGEGGDYDLPQGFQFCIEVFNNGGVELNSMVLNCTAGGKVEYLGDLLVRGRSREHLWLAQERGAAFEAWPSMGRMQATDRIVVVGTNRKDFSLEAMAVDDNVQDVIDRLTSGEITRDARRFQRLEAPAELWTATTRTVRMYQGK